LKKNALASDKASPHKPTISWGSKTASVDELISGLKPGFCFDLSACMIGFIKKDNQATT